MKRGYLRGDKYASARTPLKLKGDIEREKREKGKWQVSKM
jgi:hypothetical protein